MIFDFSLSLFSSKIHFKNHKSNFSTLKSIHPARGANVTGFDLDCRGIGATLTPDEVAAFDKEHAALLREIAGERFGIRHQIAAFIYEPI